MTDAADFFRSRLDQMIDLRHPLAILASRMPWQELEASMASVLANRVRSGKKIEGSDLFGPVRGIANPGSSGGRPRISLRLMISLLYLKHAFNESDEGGLNAGAKRPPGSISPGLRISNTARPVIRRR